jgi:hypothetical protein
MSVTTRADELKDQIKEHLAAAQKCMVEFLDPDTWGRDEYTEESQKNMEDALTELVKIRRKI